MYFGKVICILLILFSAMTGCRAAITAANLEASVELSLDEQPPAPVVEVYYDKDSGGSGPTKEGGVQAGQ